MNSIPDYAKDLRLHPTDEMEQTELTPQQAWGTAVARSLTARNRQLCGAVLAEASGKLSPQVLFGARAAAAVMARSERGHGAGCHPHRRDDPCAGRGGGGR
ncbi:MAG: hypothetical protein ACLQKA_04455 [Bryobacteraceae bacterium]